LLQASLELSRRHYAELMQMGPALANPRATREFLRARLRDRDHCSAVSSSITATA
jgi:DNA repair protein RadC